jgi:hypothetical protein
MRTRIVAVAVTGTILFLWQFLSFAALDLHGGESGYTDRQDNLLETLAAELKPGNYLLPQATPGEDQQAFLEKAHGRPWARIEYHAALDTGMTLPMIRSFVADLLAAWLLVWLLLQRPAVTIGHAVMTSLAVGGISFLTIPYLDSSWFDNDSAPFLMDWFAQWGAAGLWLGWWLGRR